MDMTTTADAAKQWGVQIRRIQALCEKGMVEGAARLGQIWVIPVGTEKPLDRRTKAAKSKTKTEVKG